MNILLLSDLHIEFWRRAGIRETELLAQLAQPADLVVLAGDINVGRTNVKETLEWFSERYPDVVYVPGNHEYYGGRAIGDFEDHEWLSGLPTNVHVLDGHSKVIQGVQFIGATLWTDFQNDHRARAAASHSIQDFRRGKITVEQMAQRHQRDRGLIKHYYECGNYSLKTVVVTHFLPATECISPRWRGVGHTESLLNKYFANDLGGWIETLGNTTWLFGHTHDPTDITLGTTRMVANPYGYPGERQQPYQPLVITI